MRTRSEKEHKNISHGLYRTYWIESEIKSLYYVSCGVSYTLSLYKSQLYNRDKNRCTEQANHIYMKRLDN